MSVEKKGANRRKAQVKQNSRRPRLSPEEIGRYYVESAQSLRSFHESQEEVSHRAPTKGQINAVKYIMKLLVEDDIARGIDQNNKKMCGCCNTERFAAGFIKYGKIDTCNPCATGYEIVKLRGETKLFERYTRIADAVDEENKRYGEPGNFYPTIPYPGRNP